MPTFLTTTRFGVQYPDPATRSASADVPRDLAALALGLENAVYWRGQGTFAARPAAAKQGGIYLATDQGKMYYDTGSAWVDIIAAAVAGANSITTAMLQDDSVTAAKIAAAAVGASEIADGSITAAEIAATLFPSQGAGAGTEALRAIGTGAGQVMAGNSFANTPDVAVFSAGPLGNGSTYTITCPAGGTYILSWGAGRFSSAGQGSSANITNNVTAGISEYGDVGGSGGPVTIPGVVLTTNQVITFTIAVSGSVSSVWARLTRTA